MRHRSIETTLKYYVAQDADEVADELWQSYRPTTPEPSAQPTRNPSGSRRPKPS